MGRAGTAAIELLRKTAGVRAVCAWDASRNRDVARIARRLRKTGVRCELGGDGVALLEDGAVRCVVKSPGVPLDHPLVVVARERGVTVIDELELAWRASTLPMVAVTGTKGKSTVTTLVASVGRAATGAAAMAGNTDFAPALSAIEAKEGIVACEVSSQQLEGCAELLPEIAILTNIHRESNRHGSIEVTAALKRTLFVRGDRCAPTAILNVDDAHGVAVAEAVERRGGLVLRYGQSVGAQYRVLDADWTLDRATATLATPEGPLLLKTRLPGSQNAVNASAAIAAGVALGLSAGEAAAAIATTPPPPGRWEPVDRGQPFDVLIDMAHTPGSIQEILTALRAVVDRRPGASLRTVLGLPGSCDMPAPREASGRVARRLSDQLVVTGAARRGEPPLVNVAFALRGAREAAGGELRVALDRAVGIRLAIRSARPGDVIVAVGRGPLRDLSTDRHGGIGQCSDAELAAEALEEIG